MPASFSKANPWKYIHHGRFSNVILLMKIVIFISMITRAIFLIYAFPEVDITFTTLAGIFVIGFFMTL